MVCISTSNGCETGLYRSKLPVEFTGFILILKYTKFNCSSFLDFFLSILSDLDNKSNVIFNPKETLVLLSFSFSLSSSQQIDKKIVQGLVFL